MDKIRKALLTALVICASLCLFNNYVYAKDVENEDVVKDSQVELSSEALEIKDTDSVIEELDSLKEVSPENEIYYNPGAYLTKDQKTALLTVSSNNSANIRDVKFDVWTGNGSNMRAYNASVQSDGRWLSFVGVSTYGQSGAYYCLPTVYLNDGSSQQLKLVSFNVDSPAIQSVSVDNVDSHAGTFDIVIQGVDAPAGVDYIDVTAFTNQDLSDVHVYRADWTGYSFVAHANVGYHQYHYGAYGVFATLYTNNGLTATNSTCGNVSAPQTKLSTYDVDGNARFLIAEDTPCDSTCFSTTFYVWNQGLNDMRAYQGFRDGNRWLAIFASSDYGRDGTFSYIVNGQMVFGPEICFGASQFNVSAASANSIWVYSYDADNGTMGVMISGVNGLGGVSGVNEVVLTKSDFSDAYGYGAINCGNGTYLFNIDVGNHRFNYGTYMISYLSHKYKELNLKNDNKELEELIYELSIEKDNEAYRPGRTFG